VLFLESAGQIYPETSLTFEAPKCVLASVINLLFIIFGGARIKRLALSAADYNLNEVCIRETLLDDHQSALFSILCTTLCIASQQHLVLTC